MSDDEEHSEAEEETSEAELALKKRREVQKQTSTHGLDDAAKELLETNRKDRDRMDDEIKELRSRNKQRKVEREQLEKKLSAQRAAEDDRRKAAEEEKRKKKEEDEQKKQRDRAKKAAEFDKKSGGEGKPNFVISKREGGGAPQEGEEEAGVVKKSKEQLDAEKKAILKQRIHPLEDIKGFDSAKLTEKVKELHKQIQRLEGEKYDLEKRYKSQSVDMMELAERARQANKVGKGGLKRIQTGGEELDVIQSRFAGAPAKVEMFSKYERQKDKRTYNERQKIHTGPQYGHPAERIKATKIVKWGEDGLPVYEEIPGAEGGEGHAEGH